jgi:Fur family transcriptional regulator, ferric uptake regulator
MQTTHEHLAPNSEHSIKELLRKNDLSITASRKQILELFAKHRGALSHGDIEKETGDRFDRVTIYRTLQTFVEKGIVHTIPTDDSSTRYALCQDGCSQGHHHDNHVHFICEQCGKIQCLEDVRVPDVKLPVNFRPRLYQMVVKGFCSACN